MNLPLDPKWIGAAIGLICGLFLVFAGWQTLLILIGFVLLGYLIGSWPEKRARVTLHVRRIYNRLFRS